MHQLQQQDSRSILAIHDPFGLQIAYIQGKAVTSARTKLSRDIRNVLCFKPSRLCSETGTII